MRKPHLDVFFPKNRDARYFSISVCGRQVAEKGHALPPRVYPSHNFSFILNGCGTFHSKYGDYRLTPGFGYFIQGGSEVSYEADEENPWEYIFVSFSGENCQSFLEIAGISAEHPVFSFPMDDEMIRILNGLIGASGDSHSTGYDVLGYFYLMISKIVPKEKCVTETDAKARCLDGMMRYIESNYERNITVQELSERFFIDRSGIYRLFERNLGISPKKYILRCRLMNAARQLRESNIGITEVAFNCGFFDHAHFSRSFFDFYGITPGEYRKNATKQK